MSKILYTLALVICGIPVFAQDFDATVNVIHPKVQVTNTQIFGSLKNSLTQFINQNKWCENQLTNVERIKLNLQLEVSSYDMNSNQFAGSLQIQAIRPVFGSTYSTLTFNQLDEYFDFTYREFQAMEFQQNTNINNLTGLVAFYIYVVLGIDFDTYSPEGGQIYYQKAQGILNASQGMAGWGANDEPKLKNRYYIIDNILSGRFKPLRQTLYDYHLNGLDLMHKDIAKGRDGVYKSLEGILELAKIFPNSMMIRVFFNAKYKELVEIYKPAPVAEQNKIIELLSVVDPVNKIYYEKIKEK